MTLSIVSRSKAAFTPTTARVFVYTRVTALDGCLGGLNYLRCIFTMTDKLGNRHTVESLADSVSMCRPAFAKRFSSACASANIRSISNFSMRRTGVRH